MHPHHSTPWSGWPDPIDRPVMPTAWPEMVAREPRLAEIEQAIRSSHPPTDRAGFFRCWETWQRCVAALLVGWGTAARDLALGHLFLALDNRADELSGNRIVPDRVVGRTPALERRSIGGEGQRTEEPPE